MCVHVGHCVLSVENVTELDRSYTAYFVKSDLESIRSRTTFASQAIGPSSSHHLCCLPAASKSLDLSISLTKLPEHPENSVLLHELNIAMAWRCHHCAHHKRRPSNAPSVIHAAPCQNFFRKPRCSHKACAQCMLGIANHRQRSLNVSISGSLGRAKGGGRLGLYCHVSGDLEFREIR